MASPNRAWARRPANRPWEPHEDQELIAAVRVGVIVEALPAVFLGHDFGDILHRRKVLIDEGRVQLAEPL